MQEVELCSFFSSNKFQGKEMKSDNLKKIYYLVIA